MFFFPGRLMLIDISMIDDIFRSLLPRDIASLFIGVYFILLIRKYLYVILKISEISEVKTLVKRKPSSRRMVVKRKPS
jgi:hypothetical protein